jgi:hypothetical protein
MWKPVALKNASRMRTRLVMRSSAIRPSPVGTSVVVSEMPSCASRYGIFATDAPEAWIP